MFEWFKKIVPDDEVDVEDECQELSERATKPICLESAPVKGDDDA